MIVMSWWMWLLIGLAIVIILSLIGRVVSGVQGLWKVICFLPILVYKIIYFIFKK